MKSHASVVHYNNEQAFFGTFLDPYRKYTSGLFEKPGMTLDEGIVAMLDKLIDVSGIRKISQPRVLDIGSGWGALYKRLSETVPGVIYVGVSPSREQNAYIQDYVDARADVRTTTFEALETDQAFDAIFLVGSFCHLENKAAQLAKMKQWLRPGGVIVIEDTFFLSEALYQKHKAHPATQFVQKEIFGFAEIHSLSSFTDQVRETGLKMTTLLEHSDCYRRTIQEWMRRLEQLDADQYPLARPYYQYMGVFQRGWNYTIGNFLVTLQALERQ